MNKKKVLVFLGSFYPYDDAISNVVLPLIKDLQSEYDVDVYTRCPNGDQPLEEDINGFHVYRDRKYDERKEEQVKLIDDIRKRDTELGITDRTLIELKKIYSKVRNLTDDEKYFEKINEGGKWFQSFRELIRHNDYNIVLTVSSPIQAQTEAIKLARSGYFKEHNIIWIPYYVDPFATYIRNLSNPNVMYFLKFETEVYRLADAVFTSTEMYKDNQKYGMGAYKSKTIPVQFASMKQNNDKYPMPAFMNPEHINIVYTGSLFDYTIRKPDTFFQIASQLPFEMDVHIACNLSNETVDELREKYLDRRMNVFWHETQPIETCFAMMQNADVLINLGNESENQTPSKVFDYIGMERPIVSFYSLENDTSAHYLENYPYKLMIQNGDVTYEKVNSFIEFAKNAKTMEIDHALLQETYAPFQSEELARQFHEKFNAVVNGEDIEKYGKALEEESEKEKSDENTPDDSPNSTETAEESAANTLSD